MIISRRTTRTEVQIAALVVAVAFVVVGCLGFVPGITTNYETLYFTGHYSTAELVGVFQVSCLNNLVHVILGVVGIVFSRTATGARLYLLAGGSICLVLWVHGLVVDNQSGANFIPVNSADDWMHFAAGVGMIAIAVIFGRGAAAGRSARIPPVQNRGSLLRLHRGSKGVSSGSDAQGQRGTDDLEWR